MDIYRGGVEDSANLHKASFLESLQQSAHVSTVFIDSCLSSYRAQVDLWIQTIQLP